MKRVYYFRLLGLLLVLPMFWMKVAAVSDPSSAAPRENPFAFQDPSLSDSAPMTRAQAAALLVRALKVQEREDLQRFSDVPAGAWYQEALGQAAAAGLFQGYRDQLRPEDPITRQEAGLVLSRLLSLEETDALLQDFIQNQPREPLSRGEFLRLANSLLPQSLEPGAQDWEIEGSVLLSSPGDYSRLTVEGDLVLTEGAEQGEISIRDALISGRLVIRGGGQVKLEGRVQAQQIEIASSSSQLRLDCQTERPLSLENHGNLTYLDGNYSIISLCRTNGQTLLAGKAEAVSLPAENGCLQALPGCQAEFADVRGDGAMILGQGQVKQAAVSAAHAQIDAPGVAVLSLSGGQVWVNGVLAQPGLNQAPASLSEQQPKSAGSSPSYFFPAAPSNPVSPDQPEQPDSPLLPPTDSVTLDPTRSDPGLLSLETQEKEDCLFLRLRSQSVLQGGLPAGLENAFQGRDPGLPFAAVTLIFQPPEEWGSTETATLSYSSDALLRMGYGPADNTDSADYAVENGALLVKRRLSAADLSGGLALTLPFSSQPEQIPISLQWGENGPLYNYLLEIDGASFPDPLPPLPEVLLSQPEVRLTAGESDPELQIDYQRFFPAENGQISVSFQGEPVAALEPEDLQEGPVRLFCPIDWENGPIPLDQDWQIDIQETFQGQTETVRWQGRFSAQEWTALLPEEPGEFDVFCPENDFLTPEQQQQLFALWEEGDGPLEGIFRFEPSKNLLVIDLGQAQGLEDWCLENLGRPEVPVCIASTPFLPGVQPEEDWLAYPILWLDAEQFSSPALLRLSAEGLPPFFLLFCENPPQTGPMD